MSKAHASVDRQKVENFFNWRPAKHTAAILGGISGAVGFVLITSNPDAAGLGTVLIVLGAILIIGHIWRARAIDKQLRDYYSAVQLAKRADFGRVLRRSYNKADVDWQRDLKPLGVQTMVDIDPGSVNVRQQDLLERLDNKYVYLFGRRDSGPDDKPIPVREMVLRVDDRIVFEYSPIFVSILYLTGNELIIYFAYIDITRGDLLVEMVNRFFVKDVVEITSTSQTSRLRRSDNPEGFKRYEKALKHAVPDEIVAIAHLLRITMTDGNSVDLPIGAPKYNFQKTGVLDSDEDEDDRSDNNTSSPPSPSSVARQIYKRITDAKAGLDNQKKEAIHRLSGGEA